MSIICRISELIGALTNFIPRIFHSRLIFHNSYFSMQRTRNNYVFALTGKTWALVKQYYPELIPKLATRGAVFARMSPDQKQHLVQELQALGYYVGAYWN